MTTRRSMEINVSAINTLLRIFVFIIYYVLLVVFGIALFWGAFLTTEFFVFKIFPLGGRLVIIILILIVGLWALVGMLGLYLIKPLFAFKKAKNENCLEIKRSDCPKLFSIIDELANTIGCKRPKHVYLSSAANACVFYNTSFWNIFFPVRKNLEIGLGLFDSTNVEELKSIIGHEFGHFSQKSMKVGSTVYVTNQIINNLVYMDDFYDKMLYSWCRSSMSEWAGFGKATRFITNLIKSMTFSMYKFVQKAYLKLSRQMEYEADTISSNNVGKEPFISALCKLEVISKRHDVYERFLANLFAQSREIGDYWQSYEIVRPYLMNMDKIQIDYETLLTEPVISNDTLPSDVAFENIWMSHPSLEDRICNVNESTVEHIQAANEILPSWSLISDTVKSKIGNYRLKLLMKEYAVYPLTTIDGQEFRDWIEAEIKNNFVAVELRPFLCRQIIPFNIDEVEMNTRISNPFVDENKLILMEYEKANNDAETLLEISNKRIEAKELKYKGKIYKSKNIPIDEHNTYLQGLKKKAELIDRQIYIYMVQNSPNGELLRKSYSAFFYTNEKKSLIEQMVKTKNELIDVLNQKLHREMDPDDFEDCVRQIDICDKKLRKFITDMEMEQFSDIVEKEAIESLKKYINDKHLWWSTSINMEKVNEMLSIIDYVTEMHRQLYHHSRNDIVMQAEELLKNVGDAGAYTTD